MESKFGIKVKTLREQQKLYLRQVAPLLEMDTAQLSKIEKGLRQIKKEQIAIIAKILKADKRELETLWVADQIIDIVKDSNTALDAMIIAENHIKLKNSHNRLIKK